MKKYLFVLLLLCFCMLSVYSVDLELEQVDITVVQDPKEDGYHFYIRKKNNISSVLITETTKDPHKRMDNFAYRCPEYNKINGNEKRLLNGKVLPASEKKLYSLIDSTPESNTPLGEAFHIWVPYIIVYGYSWTRQGEVQVLDGTFFNIRTFEKPYADYTGAFSDNPFVLRVTQKKMKTPQKGSFSKSAVQSFTKLAQASGNRLIYASKIEHLIPSLEVVMMPNHNRYLDVVFVVDATASMKDSIELLRESLTVALKKVSAAYFGYRMALVLFKDYNDDFLTNTVCDFTENPDQFEKALHSFKVFGGRDIPEAVYEGIFAGLALQWDNRPNTDRRLILIGDAPPHPRPKGSITGESILKKAQEKQVQVSTIILPHKPVY